MKDISINKAAALAFQHYGIKGEVTRLQGEADLNFRIRSTTGKKYLLKISTELAERNRVELEAAIMAHLSKKETPFQSPTLIPSISGATILQEEEGIIRL